MFVGCLCEVNQIMLSNGVSDAVIVDKIIKRHDHFMMQKCVQCLIKVDAVILLFNIIKMF